jgi:hypothetical protein
MVHSGMLPAARIMCPPGTCHPGIDVVSCDHLQLLLVLVQRRQAHQHMFLLEDHKNGTRVALICPQSTRCPGEPMWH